MWVPTGGPGEHCHGVRFCLAFAPRRHEAHPEASVFDRLDDDARLVMTLARKEAQGLHQELIGTEHILLGLMRMEPILMLLEDLSVRAELVRRHVEARAARGETATMGQLPFTVSANRALELSLECSQAMQHDCIAPEHILIGLLLEDTGLAGEVLREQGLRPETLSNPGHSWWWRFW